MAEWLNTTFSALDSAVFGFMNQINCEPLNVIFKYISVLGIKAWFFFFLGAVLLLFRKSRRTGVCVLGAVLIGALFTNLILKGTVARARPYTVSSYYEFWQLAGSNLESEFSFPSGHTTSATAAFMAIFLSCDKKWSWLGILGAFVMAFARVYLIVHYTTDVIGGFIVGTVASVISFYIVKAIYKAINKHYDTKFCAFVLGADIKNLFKKKQIKKDNK